MDGSDFLERIETDLRTELSRLGSSKSLYADTVGEMEPQPVLQAAADAAGHASETFESWAAETDLDVFASAASRERDHEDAIAEELDEADRGEPPAAVATLADVDGTIRRLGAVVGWSLVAERKSTQTSGFFTGQADPATAGTFRSFGEEYEQTRQEALDALADRCESEADWDEAASAATATISAAYDEYFETLESLGMNPKPVC